MNPVSVPPPLVPPPLALPPPATTEETQTEVSLLSHTANAAAASLVAQNVFLRISAAGG